MKYDKTLSKDDFITLKIRLNALRKNEKLGKMAKRAVKTEKFQVIFANDGLWSPEIFHSYMGADFDETYKDFITRHPKYAEGLCREQQQIRDDEFAQLR